MSAKVKLVASIDGVDAAWVSDVLGAEVTGVSAERIALDTGFSSELWRVALESADASVPASVIVKLPTTTVVREAMDMVGGYAREVAFYAEVAGRSPLATPTVYFSQQADDSTDFTIVLEDLGGWENGNHYEGLPLARATACLDQLAALHGWSATPENVAGLEQRFPPLDSPIVRQAFPMLAAEGWGVYKAQAREPIPSDVAAYVEDLPRHIVTLLEGLSERRCLIHGDIRADNLFFGPNGELSVVDFQLPSFGAGMVDVGYLISQGLTTAERGDRDEELVRGYLDALAQRDPEPYAFEDAWRHYKLAVLFGIVIPIIAIRGWDLLPQKSQELCLRLLERSIATIASTDALEVLR